MHPGQVVWFHGIVTQFVFTFFFFNDTATTEIYTLSLHDALPISPNDFAGLQKFAHEIDLISAHFQKKSISRSEEHTSELQSLTNLVCRLLLEKKKSLYRRVVAGSHAHERYRFQLAVVVSFRCLRI